MSLIPMILNWTAKRRSREGAWIEIKSHPFPRRSSRVAPVRERGLKYVALQDAELIVNVAPVRERGLK